jgi:hypothetical protein
MKGEENELNQIVSFQYLDSIYPFIYSVQVPTGKRQSRRRDNGGTIGFGV